MLPAYLLLLAAQPVPGVAAPNAPPPTRSLQVDATFVDTTTGQWTAHEKPVLARKPDLAKLARANPQSSQADFGLSFNCQVSGSGALKDCRTLYAVPDVNGDELTRALAPLLRLSPASADTARRKAYRVTIDAGLSTNDRFGMPKQCTPPFCMIEGATPPPPPERPEDPVLRDAFARAEACYSAEWEKSATLRFAAEKAMRESAPEAGSPEARAAALDYVRSRQALMQCIADLEQASRAVPMNSHDRAAVDVRLKGMRRGYFGQAKFEMAILIGLLDKRAAVTEESAYYPY